MASYDIEVQAEQDFQPSIEGAGKDEVTPDSVAELHKYLESQNMAEDLEEDTLKKVGREVCDWFDEDEDARRPWQEKNDQWLKLATQVMEKKSYPWPDAANVKFPLLTTAAMQFAARAYPALVPGPNLVSGLVIGRDEGGIKQQSAERIGRHMSYQLMWEMDNWEEDMDRLCLMLPIAGCLFKKTYYDPIKEKNCSELIAASDLVIDYFAKSVETASRKAHVIYKTENEIKERVNRGLFLDVPINEPVPLDKRPASDAINGTEEPPISPATPHKLIECHCWWDFDGDGYSEPYIVTCHYDSKRVLRIVARFDEEGIKTYVDPNTGKEKLIAIEPIEYFTKFGFIPNPDGSIYDLGFGLLLGGINEAVNTLTNQLLDSGTLHNLQAGFLGRGIRIRSGNSRFIPGEWKPVDFTGDDIKKHIFPLPTKEPSDVLFKLLETLVTSGKELASVAEIFVGKMPGQNTPATTTMATIEQGLKVFTAIYKRIYRALGKEYQKLFRLNGIYLDEQVYFTINEQQGPQTEQVYKEDYSNDITVKPNADPNIVSSAQKLMKVQSYGALLQLGTINPLEYTKRYLDAVEADNISSLINMQPKADPEQQKMQAEMMMKQQEHQMKMQLEQIKLQFKEKELQMDLQFKQMEMQLKGMEAQMDLQISQQTAAMDMDIAQQEHAQDKALGQEKMGMQREQMHQKHDLAMEQNKLKAKEQAAKPKGKSKNGESSSK